MGTPYFFVITLIVTAGVLNVLMGLYALSGRSKLSMVKTFFAFSIFAAIYTFASALELASSSSEEIYFWIKIEYLGIPFLPPLNLLFILYFLGMERFLKRSLRFAMFIIPVITLLLVLTNDYHHLYYQDIVLRGDSTFLRAIVVAGPWYIIQGVFTFACMISGVYLLLRSWRKMPSYRYQLGTMLVGLLLPLAGDFLYLGGFTPIGLDPVPVIMSVTSGLYLWALMSKGLFHVAPIARDNLFTSMRDGVLMLDLESRLVDYNPAAVTMIPELGVSSIGQPLYELWNLHADQPIFEFSNLKEKVDVASDIQEIHWYVDGQMFNYEVRYSVVRNQSGQHIGQLIVLIDVTERARLQEELRQMAYYDGLTKIFNRGHFMNRSNQLLREAFQNSVPLTIILFDIDHFKQINDAFGHVTGDQALFHVAEVCQKELRTVNNLFARYGGEEFVIALPGMTISESEVLAERIRTSLATHSMSTSQGPLSITASFGIAETNSSVEGTPVTSEVESGQWDMKLQLLLKKADRALYEAKHSGRNTVRKAE